MTKNYNSTIFASFVGFMVQAVINNFAPLLFLTFQDTYHISLNSISFLITVNFCVQLAVDLLCAKMLEWITYRIAMIIAHIAAACGLLGLALLPELLPDPLAGLLVSVCIYAVGGGIIEVLASPIVESCPTDNKEAAMSLAHSFYCWGHVAVVVVSTAFFAAFGIDNWRLLACLWALLPVANGILFACVPMAAVQAAGERGMPLRDLLSLKLFWVMFLMMVCSGACEQGMSQWASAFAESALQIPKATGDLAGPLTFALLMGISRAIYARFSEKIRLERWMLICSSLCIGSYLLASLSANPVVSFIGCGLCGFSVGIMWPGTTSLAAAQISRGGTAMFAFFALGGDVGCSVGPAVVAAVADFFKGDLKAGILAAALFPLLLLLTVLIKGKMVRK